MVGDCEPEHRRASSSRSIKRKRRILIDQEQKVGLHPHEPSERADAELVHSGRIAAGEEDDEPRRYRGEALGQQHEEQNDDVRNQEEKP
jgi:hypothetical protein